MADQSTKILSDAEGALHDLYSDILHRTANAGASSKLRNDIWELATDIRVLARKFGGLKDTARSLAEATATDKESTS